MAKIDFIKTEAYKNIKNFLYQVDISIKEDKQEHNIEHIKMLESISNKIESTALDESSHRFANNACLEVFKFLKNESSNIYFLNSFGNSTRMDYGTGHELNYFCYLYTLYKSGCLKINEVFGVLKVYFRVVRSFLNKFNIEPAGSQGIWGIDDYQILPYVFGSSELFNSSRSVFELDAKYCYIECLKSSKNKKSLVLQSFRNKRWVDINRTLLNMYDLQIFKKNVITQHFIYSEFLPNVN
ncbi:Serine/threonine-protein phosphatase 2A activator [Nosema granulosis]|uniref:Serine/threonine-protein phosphatase 2A activator n=1 Tax=Nosema granulosis TaxID=83296 RepID=A0A9P6L024_9MICR|nr:Serine/threonine-protein phosphatase 2A activator [Nosema granulosis]